MTRGRPLAALLLAACGLAADPARGASGGDDVTFNRDIAPIVFSNCASCHRPGEVGPFSLLTYQDVRKRARQIVLVTASRYMPPWLPEPGEVALAGRRGLSDDEIARIRRWVEGGLVEGDPAELPALPRFPEGWQLGTPDLVLELPVAYTLAAEGPDVVRNFVIPAPVPAQRWIKTVELRPGNQRIVHHAILKQDTTRYSRRLDEREPGPGFGGMELGNAEYPDGQIIVWTPGSAPHPGMAGVAWSLDHGTDLVLQLHMIPSGKAEEVRPKIGLYFADGPPTVRPYTLLLRNDRIDIPPGERAYVVEDSFMLPVPVKLLGLYPHAHYLAKRMEIFAARPDGSRQQMLLRIERWDFNWQGMYRLEQPLALDRGTTLHMRYSYDNSAANVRNPSHPPRRVTIGNRSSDEMATLALQVLPANDGDLAALRLAQWEDLLRDQPENPVSHYNLGVAYALKGDLAQAVVHYERALGFDPDDSSTHYYLAGAYFKLGDMVRAAEHYAAAVRIDPDFAEAHLVLGFIRYRRGELEPAAVELERAIAIEPELAQAHYYLGLVREQQGDRARAADHYGRAAALDPAHDEARRALERLRTTGQEGAR